MNPWDTVQLQELTEAEVYALAELCKRIGFADARSLAIDEDETLNMITATCKLRDALELAGVVVR